MAALSRNAIGSYDREMEKSRALKLLQNAAAELDVLPDNGNYQDPVVKQWLMDTKAKVEAVFGVESRQLKDFVKIFFGPRILTNSRHDPEQDRHNREGYTKGKRDATVVVTSFIREVEEVWQGDPASVDPDPLVRLDLVFRRFHQVVLQLRRRHGNRPTLNVVDEYDLQDLLHAILILDFDDVRAEEPAPSYAGGSSRMDFVLKRERIVVEVKKTRQGLGAKQIGSELIEDIQRYQAHPDCNVLVCFVYDPEGLVANARGVSADLERATSAITVRVYIQPQ